MNYGNSYTEDSICLQLGRQYGIIRGLDCGPNIIMTRYQADGIWVKPGDVREACCIMNMKQISYILLKVNPV